MVDLSSYNHVFPTNGPTSLLQASFQEKLQCILYANKYSVRARKLSSAQGAYILVKALAYITCSLLRPLRAHSRHLTDNLSRPLVVSENPSPLAADESAPTQHKHRPPISPIPVERDRLEWKRLFLKLVKGCWNWS
ncbi:hypothetical protein J6590_036112 [Homalodisca vitripennis]|nr:hypothetical protein J6590_036112 [Homalodisca vitripennis]